MMKIAIAHDDFMQWGGAERVVAAMLEIWPQAHLYTSVYDPALIQSYLAGFKVRASFLQNYLGRRFYRSLFFLHPLAFESFDFSGYDVVISSTARFAKAIRTKPHTLHLCYCNTPVRFLWPIDKANRQSWVLEPLLFFLRMYDYTVAQQVDYFIANSHEVARRIKKFYRRRARVIYPFVDLERFGRVDLNLSETTKRNLEKLAREGYFLIVARLSPQKRVDLAVEAFKRLPNEKLIVIGDGPERVRLESKASRNVRFLGRVSDKEVVAYLQNCKAFIYPQREDFGITALEAQACGKPVIAYGKGGVLETVIEGETGIFFKKQTPQALTQALQRFLGPEGLRLSPEKMRENASRFSKKRFQTQLKRLVESLIK